MENYLNSRNIDQETAKLFELSYHTEGVFKGRVVMPVYSLTGSVIGYTGRLCGEGSPKYLHTKNMPMGSTFFGIQCAEVAKELYIVEGNFDVLRLYSAGKHNCVGISGTSLSDTQVQILQLLKVAKVVLMLDGDSAGVRATHKIGKQLIKAGIRVSYIPLTEGADPGSMTNDEINNLVEREFYMDYDIPDVFDYLFEDQIKDYAQYKGIDAEKLLLDFIKYKEYQEII